MSAEPVFTYWEGERYPFTSLCIASIGRVFGGSHVHLTPTTLEDWIDLPREVMASPHFSFRSDYIRSLLLQAYGGWWFDSDVLLFRDPSLLVELTTPQIWTLIYRVEGSWEALVNNGILYSPPGSLWITSIVNDFAAVDVAGLHSLTRDNEDVGQGIYERHSTPPGAYCAIGHQHDFNSTFNVDADFAPFWDGTIDLHSARFGLHVGASLSRWAARSGVSLAASTLESRSLVALIDLFPESVVSQYVARYGIGNARSL